MLVTGYLISLKRGLFLGRNENELFPHRVRVHTGRYFFLFLDRHIYVCDISRRLIKPGEIFLLFNKSVNVNCKMIFARRFYSRLGLT